MRLLFMDELEDSITETEVIKKYLKISTGLVASQVADFFGGKLPGAGEYQYGILCGERKKLAVPEWRAAYGFYPNTVSVWENDEFVKSRITDEERMTISDEIKSIGDSKANDGNTHWIMRRIVIQKR